MSNFPPLSGALLITNPRKEMSLALENPNDRRRINMLARVAHKTGESPKALVAEWLATKNLPKKQRPAKFQMTSLGSAMVAAGGGKAFFAANKKRKQSAAEKAAYAKSKREVASAFAEMDPEHYKVQNGPFGRKKSYASRALAGHGRRYLLKRKREAASFFGGRVKSQAVNREALRSAKGAAKRVMPRGAFVSNITAPGSEITVMIPTDRAKGLAGGSTKRQEKASGKWYQAKKAGGSKARAGRQSTKRRGDGGAGLAEYRALAAKARAAGIKSHGMSLKELRELQHVVANPGSALVPWGCSALSNPSMDTKQYLLGYAVPVAVAGGVAGGIHAMAASAGITERISSTVGMIPVAGSYLQKAPFTLQGLLVGSAAALAAGFIGGRTGGYIALAGGAAIVLGGGMDAFNYISGSSEESEIDSETAAALAQAGLEGESASLNDLALMNGMGDLALTNSMGDLALTNMGALALGNSADLGDGFAYEVAPLTASVDGSADYGQASLADAQFCGADFSMQEGSAIVNGRDSYLGCYGSPTRRAGVVHSGPSHMAGRPGHRWGWLIKVVGWRRAAIIAALPPAKRVKVIRQIRTAAIRAFNRSAAQWANSQSVPSNGPAVDTTGTVTSVPEGLPAAGTVTGGAEGAAGVGGFLGDPALFMGA